MAVFKTVTTVFRRDGLVLNRHAIQPLNERCASRKAVSGRTPVELAKHRLELLAAKFCLAVSEARFKIRD